MQTPVRPAAVGAVSTDPTPSSVFVRDLTCQSSQAIYPRVTTPSLGDSSATTFGDRLRLFRKDRVKTQQELADLIGVSFTYVSKIEKPNGPIPSPEMITKIAGALGLNDDETAELFRLAQMIPPSVEEMMVKEPEAVDFYRVVNRRMSDTARRDFFKKLIDELEAGGTTDERGEGDQ